MCSSWPGSRDACGFVKHCRTHGQARGAHGPSCESEVPYPVLGLRGCAWHRGGGPQCPHLLENVNPTVNSWNPPYTADSEIPVKSALKRGDSVDAGVSDGTLLSVLVLIEHSVGKDSVFRLSAGKDYHQRWGLGSRAGRPGSGEDQYKFPNSSHGASRGHTETLVQNQPRGLGALAAADGSQDRHRPDTDMRAPGIVLAGQGPPASPGQELRQEGWPRMLLPGLWQLAGKFGLNVVREKP
ncbi:hypothetical protein E5288_WYG017884 [Bos mutus]|uniref:Uncharacterized protein n=1 Tax=Bos mutus TaxID=72004 RepID=A0A6B0S4W6_9CETA|nr:hypothetical protein [Bos mutus]